MNKINPPYFPMMILIGLMIATGYIFYLYYDLRITANKLQVETGSISTNRTNLRNLSLLLPRLSPEMKEWSKSLPASEEEVALFASFLDRVAKEQNVVMDIHFGDFPTVSDISGKKMQTLPLDITIEGSYQGIIQFIGQISTSKYFYKIDKLSLTKPDLKPSVKTIIVGWLIMGENKQ